MPSKLRVIPSPAGKAAKEDFFKMFYFTSYGAWMARMSKPRGFTNVAQMQDTLAMNARKTSRWRDVYGVTPTYRMQPKLVKTILDKLNEKNPTPPVKETPGRGKEGL